MWQSEVYEDLLRITSYPLSTLLGPLSHVPKKIEQLIVHSECELYCHLVGVHLENQVHQLVSKNQTQHILIDQDPSSLIIDMRSTA